jgi:hypothetical protein
MDLEAGVQVGDFKIEKRLGAGGMGIDYQARQVSLDRLVALKVLGNALDRDSDLARFQRKAQAIARLNHPGIASVHFIGQDQHVCYMAMEFIEGVSLRKVMDRLADLRDQEQAIDSVAQEIPLGEGVAPACRFDLPTATIAVQSPTGSEGTDPEGISFETPRLIATKAYLDSAPLPFSPGTCRVAVEADVP